MRLKDIVTNQAAFTILGACLLGAPMHLAAKQKPEAQQDGIRVIAHLMLDGKAQGKMLRAAHWSKQYLYIQSADARRLTILDVSVPCKPKFVQRLATGADEANVADVVGTTALLTHIETKPAPTDAKTVTVMSFAEPAHPRMVQQFNGVTAMLSEHGLIYLVNADGLWILQEQPAEDKEIDRAYSDYILYNH